MWKKNFLNVMLIIFLLSMSSCSKSYDIYIGMNYEEFIEIINDEKIVNNGSYYFFEEKDDNVIVKFNLEMKIEDIKKFKKIVADDEKFSSIKSGTHMYEVVELVGIPVANITSGENALTFKSKTGKLYTIIVDANMTVIEVVQNN